MKLPVSSVKIEGADANQSLEDIIKQNKKAKKAAAQAKNPLKGTQGGGVTKKKNKGQQGKQVKQQQTKQPQPKPKRTGAQRNNGNQGNFRQQQNRQMGFRQQQNRQTGFRQQQNRRMGFEQQIRQMGLGKQMNRRMGFVQQDTLAKSSKLAIANLHVSVTDQDIRELFSEFGVVKTAAVHYGSNGTSLGIAHVHFQKTTKNSAAAAIRKYNGVHLDGRPMRISITDGPAVNQTQRGGQNNFQPQRLSGGPQRNQGRNMGMQQNQGNKKQNQANKGQQNQGKKKPQNQANKGQQNQGKKKPQNQGNKGQQNQGKRKPQKKAKKPAQKKEEPMTLEQLNDQLDAYVSSK